MKLLVIGNLENRRVTQFKIEAQLHCEIVELSWLDYLTDASSLSRLLGQGVDFVRIESPGENDAVHKYLISKGETLAEAEKIYQKITSDQLHRNPLRNGEIGYLRQWYHGFRSVLHELNAQLSEVGVSAMNSPIRIAKLFDKAVCHEHCEGHGLAVPSLVHSSPASFDEIISSMQSESCSRVFIKPRHGSSASGVMALQISNNEMIAMAPIEHQNGSYFNTLRIQRLCKWKEIGAMVDFLCQQAVIVERWFPKIGHCGKTVDLRVLSVGGQPSHAVLRSSKSPITNLHLGNVRGDMLSFKQTLGSTWGKIQTICQSAAQSWPAMHYLAMDVMVSPNHSLAFAEFNAFGDLLPNIVDEDNRTCYQAEVIDWLNKVGRT